MEQIIVYIFKLERLFKVKQMSLNENAKIAPNVFLVRTFKVNASINEVWVQISNTDSSKEVGLSVEC